VKGRREWSVSTGKKGCNVIGEGRAVVGGTGWTRLEGVVLCVSETEGIRKTIME
jgi:hypothetical protein